MLEIGYFADGVWGHNAFRLLNRDPNIIIKFICVRNDTTDEILKKMAEENGIDYLRHSNINSAEFLKTLKSYHCDLFVSMSFNQIFKKDIIDMPEKGIINCHAGKLPFYRGRNILNWVLINDEKEFGITVHYVDEGIDTGDILLQNTYPITDKDNYASLLEIAYTECASILHEAINLIIKGEERITKQESIHQLGIYCGKRTSGDEIIDWHKTSREIFNFVRAICLPGPMARTTLNGKEFKINKVSMIDGAMEYIGIPGQIVGKVDNGYIVKTLDTTLRLDVFEYEGKIKIGDRLGRV